MTMMIAIAAARATTQGIHGLAAIASERCTGEAARGSARAATGGMTRLAAMTWVSSVRIVMLSPSLMCGNIARQSGLPQLPIRPTGNGIANSHCRAQEHLPDERGARIGEHLGWTRGSRDRGELGHR